jgi:hypothetical protein
LRFLEETEFPAQIDHLQREDIFIAANSPVFRTIQRGNYDGAVLDAGSSPALPSASTSWRTSAAPSRLVGVENHGLELLGWKLSGSGEIGTDWRAATIYLVAVQTLRLCFKNHTASLATARDGFRRRVCPSQTADVGNQFPSLFGGELREGRHCRASNTRSDVLKDFTIGGPVFQETTGEGGRPLTPERPRAVAALARSVV